MDGKQKLFLVVLGILMAVVSVKYGLSVLVPSEITPEQVQVEERITEEDEVPKVEEKEKVYVHIFFIGQNQNHEEVYKAVKREYDKDIDGSKLKFAINSLVTGPKVNEREKGVYTEIPVGTEIISIKELPDKAIINLSSEFETGHTWWP